MGAPINPAILFEPDGYRMDGQKVMGRHSAGNGFLRAAVAAAGTDVLYGYTPSRASAEVWVKTVKEIRADARPEWAPPTRTELMRQARQLYVPGPNLAAQAGLRMRVGMDAWSITGITHTLASHAALDALASLVTLPLMPWDALICTSSAALSVATSVIDEQKAYLAWRLGASFSALTPRLPVIPLGVHCQDFETAPGERDSARLALGLAADEVVALFMGRLLFHAKAHPHAMYLGLQAAARNSGRKLVLIQCGQFPNPSTEAAFRSGVAACPDVRCVFIDGKDDTARRQCWAGADFFISLSDNIQETFGLTPIEAMAAGLPVVVTDWDGYKDTVRDGIDGFRIPTFLTGAGEGASLAADYESGVDTYDMFCGLACMNLSVDLEALASALTSMVSDADLRKRMGAAARERATSVYDWSHIYAAYRELWQEQDALRQAHGPVDSAPRHLPARPDPFSAFGHFPTHALTRDTLVSLRAGATPALFDSLRAHPLFGHLQKSLPDPRFFLVLQRLLKQGPRKAGQLADAVANERTLRWISTCAKMGLLDLHHAVPLSIKSPSMPLASVNPSGFQ